VTDLIPSLPSDTMSMIRLGVMLLMLAVILVTYLVAPVGDRMIAYVRTRLAPKQSQYDLLLAELRSQREQLAKLQAEKEKQS